MNRWKWFLAILLTFAIGAPPPPALAEGRGQEDLDEALRVKVTAENLRDLNEVIELLESAIEKGLDVENSDFAEQLLVESLMERAAQLTAVVQSVPGQRLVDPQMQRVRGLAVSDLRRVMEYDIAPPQSKLLLAQLLSLPGGDRDEALKILDDLFDDEGLAALPAKIRAEAFLLRATLHKDPEKALADFNAAVELEPNEEQHRLARADFYRQQKKFDEAIADIDAVLEKNPDQAAGYLIKAQLQREQEKLDDALASLDKASELAPSSPAPYQQRGEIYRLQENYEKAIEQFNKVLEMQPGLLLAMIHRAEAYLASEQYDLALADAERVLKDNPGLTVAHSLKAQALASQDKLPEAIEEMKKLAEAEPEQLEFRMQLALYYLVDKQTPQAIEAYGEILKRDPENFAALRGRADAYLNIGEHAAAVADFEKAVAVDGEDSGVLNNFAWVLATSPDDEVRDGKRAIELATKACELTEYKASHILSTLAAAYAETGDFETARKWSQKAVDMKEPEHLAQLEKELESYKQEKPWRERQTPDEDEKSDDEANAAEEKPAADAEETPAAAEAPGKPVEL